MTQHVFTDAAGREWDVSLNLLRARRVDSSDFSAVTDRKFTLLRPDRETFTYILADTPVLFAVIWAVVQDQVQANLDIDLQAEPGRLAEAEEQFTAALDGPAVAAARESFWEALAAFFPEHRTVLSTLLSQYRHAQEKTDQELRSLEEDLTRMVDTEISRGVEMLRTEMRRQTPATPPG